ncbi:MAG TPA: FadR/GntR family transcriptional regulator [Candidatus Methylomirabilis sp.]|nr:FadR/GntR family transcriptional regulator [Candidatus Methylomirabilis sp.]HSC69737.1 FadR/GntR family transcriptional regulator [Candidatus Methylomirabilis sp.]
MQTVSEKAFHVIHKTRVSKEIIDQVRDLISSGRLKPGDRLPSERELAHTFHVGRSTVREAIRSMESLGLIDVRAGEGTFLAGPKAERTHDPLSANLFQAWGTHFKLFEVRSVLEPALAGLAARRATSEQIEAMRGILADQEREILRGESGKKEDTVFHHLIAEATGNEILHRIADSLMSLLGQTRETSLQRGGRPLRSYKQHQAILEAIEARNPAAAERRMREHIRSVERLIFSSHQKPTEGAEGPVAPVTPKVSS